MNRVPFAATCGMDSSFTTLRLKVHIMENGYTSFILEGDNNNISISMKSPYELRRIFEMALEVIDEAVAEKKRRESDGR
jgi:hypothetical protein